MTLEITFDDDGTYRIYDVRKQNSHHKNGWKSIRCERIMPENLPKKTLVKLMQKGANKIPKEILP